MVCNFGMIPFEDCGDGICYFKSDICDFQCDGNWEQVCEDNKVV